MKLQDQVISLKLAKQLKELGVKQDSLFYWVRDKEIVYQRAFYTGSNEIYTSAFTVAELGEILPFYLKKDADEGIVFSTEVDGLRCYRWSNGWTVAYKYESISSDTLANTMAKMLIYLLENNLLTENYKLSEEKK